MLYLIDEYWRLSIGGDKLHFCVYSFSLFSSSFSSYTIWERIKFTLITFAVPIIYFIHMSASIDVHIDEVNTYSRDHKKAFTFLNQGVFIQEGFKTSKIRSGVLKGVQLDRLFIKEGVQLDRLFIKEGVQ